MTLTDVCIRRPVLAWMIMAAVVLAGVVAFKRIGVSQFPDVDFPVITVSIGWEGAAPEAVEKDVVDVLEEALAQVEGVQTIRSSARLGAASISVELDLARSADLALQDVQAKVSQNMARLPKDINPPVVNKQNPEDNPIMWLSLSGPFSPQVLSDFARYRVRERMQAVPGVGEIMLGGFLERNVRLWIDRERLDARGVTVTDVLSALKREHVELPAGRIDTGAGREIDVRVMGEALDLATMRRLTVADRGGRPVYLEDVALVEDGFEDQRQISRVDGVRAQGFGIKKQRGSNAVKVAEGVRAAVAKLTPTLPPGMEMMVNFDSTKFISESVDEIIFEIGMAVALTSLMCWLFLGSWSSTFNIILAIPMSLLGTVAVLYFAGMTLNTFTLLGLGLAVGIVVDDAIMVLENITRHAERGENRIRAAQIGTREIAFAALASTIAVIAIFSPVLFMSGVIGRFFLQFGLALSIAIMLSYLEAVTLAPARCAQMLNVDQQRRTRLGRLADTLFSALERLYAAILPRVLRHPWMTIASSVLLFAASLGVFTLLPKEFVPSQDQSRLMVRVQTAVGSNLAEVDRLMGRVESYINAQPEIAHSYAIIGNFGNNSGSLNNSGMFITLVPPSQRKATQAEVQNRIRREFETYPGVEANIIDMSGQAFTAQRGFPIEFNLRGNDWEGLIAESKKLMERMRASGLMVGVNCDVQMGMPELRVTPDRDRCADLGVPMEQVASTINALIGGVKAGKFSDGGKRMDIRVRLLSDQRFRPEDLDRIFLRTARGDQVPLSALVTTEERPALQAIFRRDRERAVSLWANLAPGIAQGTALKEVEVYTKDLPAGYRLVLAGNSASFGESMSGLLWAMGFGVLVAYMVLAAQFNSLLHPLTVLSVLPLSITGAGVALWLGHQSLNVFSVIGMLLLMGIAKKNSIILVDYANRCRRPEGGGLDAAGAMLKAGPVRLRPILMTSSATMLAAVPLAIGLGPGSELRAPMAIAIIGGVLVSTLLSLLVVPAFYLLADRLVAFIGRFFGRTSPRSASGADSGENHRH